MVYTPYEYSPKRISCPSEFFLNTVLHLAKSEKIKCFSVVELELNFGLALFRCVACLKVIIIVAAASYR